MTATPAPATPSVALSAARQAQKAYVRHVNRPHLLNLYPCAECLILDLTAQAAYYRAEAEADAELMRALDAAREAGIAW